MLNPINNNRRTNLKSDLNMTSLKEAQYWAQRAKKLWIKDGDEDMGFFHKVCSAKQRRSFISKLIDENIILYNINATIAEAFINHFKSSFNGSNRDNMLIENLDWNPIDNSFHSMLCAPFEEDEIKKDILTFSNNKAPGPDGFSIQFYKKETLATS